MHFTSDGEVLPGHYSGGAILAGQVLARRNGEGKLDMVYHGARRDGSMAAGQASGRIVPDETGTLRMYLKW